MSIGPLPDFEPQPATQVAFLRARRERIRKLTPLFESVRDRLLALGGLDVVLPLYDTFEKWQRLREDFYASALLERGCSWPGSDARSAPGALNNCHENAASLFVDGRGHIATGYALAFDGLWRPHSWVVRVPSEDGPPLIETTVEWLGYHGAVLRDDEARRFARDELGAAEVDSWLA
jgi:hypothetical protein